MTLPEDTPKELRRVTRDKLIKQNRRRVEEKELQRVGNA